MAEESIPISEEGTSHSSRVLGSAESNHTVTVSRRCNTAPLCEPLRKEFLVPPASMYSYNIRIHEYRVKELTKDANKISLSFERYLNELISFTIYSGYPQIKEAVIKRAKIKKKLRDARK